MLCIASSVVLLHTLPNPFLILLIYLATIVYYTHAYIQECRFGEPNERVIWYQKNKRYLTIRQFVFSFLLLFIAFSKFNLLTIIFEADVYIKFILFFSALLSVIYYVPNFNIPIIRSYRTKGILKSIAIAWVWCFACCFLPIWIQAGDSFNILNENFVHYWASLFLYVLVLAILFDIKDIQKDKHHLVNTIAVQLGSARTVKIIVGPLLLLYYLVIIHWVSTTGLLTYFLMIQALFVIISYVIARFIIHQKAIFANVLLIDGLLILKAVLSILFL